MPSLFDPIRLGAIDAPNRILMAPLTRARSGPDALATPIMAQYYAQRAGAGLIISEATGISREGLGWPDAPGLWSDAHVEAWKPVTEAVHQAGGRIFAQLWHMGRLVHSSMGGGQPLSASATTAPNHAHTYLGKQDYEEARALQIDEIPRLLEDYARAARNAIAAGFDGAEIHAANGYLIDQFLRDNSNFRDDAYGGSPENRIRLLREVTTSVAGEIGADRTAVRVSPNGMAQGVIDSDPAAVFVPAARALSEIGLAFLEVLDGRPGSSFRPVDQASVSREMRAVFSGPLVLNSDFLMEDSQHALDEGRADAISFGRPFIANPDLPERFRRGAPLADPGERASWYLKSGGYADFPALAD